MALLKFMARYRVKGKWHFGVLALALVLAQSIGLIHGIAHAPLLTDAQVVLAGDAPNSVVEHLFGDHHDQNGNATCHLFDQSNHLDGLCDVHAVVLPTLLATVVAIAFSGLFTARRLAAFHARGPPTFR